VLSEGESGYTNRVHVYDLVRACVAAGERGDAGAYNVSDGQPGTMTGYFNAVADALGLPRPPLISGREAAGRLSDGMLSYLRESRRIDNRRMREVLGVTPKYADLAAGLAAITEDVDDLP
jgi:nucleoside-diphosphate-sugar epimerase